MGDEKWEDADDKRFNDGHKDGYLMYILVQIAGTPPSR